MGKGAARAWGFCTTDLAGKWAARAPPRVRRLDLVGGGAARAQHEDLGRNEVRAPFATRGRLAVPVEQEGPALKAISPWQGSGA